MATIEQNVTTFVTEEERNEHAILDTLAKLGGQRVQQDALKQQGTELILPETMSIPNAIEYLRDWQEAMEQETHFTRTFQFRPLDVAHALDLALKEVFGTAGIGKPTWTFFGKKPPQQRSINIGYGRTTQVPWGELHTPMLGGTIDISLIRHPEFGFLGHLNIYAPKKYAAHIEGLFIAVERMLSTHSIYKGKPIDGQSEPEFLDLRGVDPSKVIYSDKVMENLETNIWAYLKNSDLMRSLDVSLKRANLLFGPWGTGKTLAAFLTAKIAVENGWTFLYCRPAKDNIQEVMQTARLYQPSVVFVEDVDTIASSGEDEEVTKLLDVFDGITSKGTEIQVILTTNHPERIHKAMMRPGRLDSMTEIGALDRHGVQRMIEATVEPRTIKDGLDYDAIFEAMEGYLPAFVAEAVKRAIVTAATREGTRPKTFLTDDFIIAAHSLRDQYERMSAATEGERKPTLEQTFGGIVEKTLDGTTILDYDGDRVSPHGLRIATKNDHGE